MAIDLYGATGTMRRRRLVMMEFVVGTAALVGLGVVLTVHGGWLWGLWLLGCGLSHATLAMHAVTLYPSHRLGAELHGVDVAHEVHRYSWAQLLLFVPGLVATVAIAETLPTCHKDAHHGGRRPRAPR